jgi:hypothetical protein
VLELRNYARTGPLGGFISDPPAFLSPKNGVVGVGLSYDESLVRAINQAHFADAPRDTVEHSAGVAQALASLTTPASEKHEWTARYDWIVNPWRDLSYRRYGRVIKPVVLEISLDPDFPRGGSSVSKERPYEFFEDHRIIYRRAHRPRLHYAEAGGRLFPEGAYPPRAPRWGTLGGFVEATDGRLYAVTAAHVAHQSSCFGTPAFVGVDILGLRPLFQRAVAWSPKLVPGRWAGQRGRRTNFSAPEIVLPNECRAHTTPESHGLDVALAEWPSSNDRDLRRQAGVVSIGQVSQILPLAFTGAATGVQEVSVAALSIWHSYELPGDANQFACISDCLQIKHRERPIWWSDVSTGGDSGAWVMAKSINGPAWSGLIIGGDGERTGVVPSERIISRFQSELGPLRPMI